MRVARPVILSPEERTRLDRWARANSRHDVRSLRARMILGAADGLQDIEIGRKLGISRLTVARWRQRFLSERLRAIGGSISTGLRLGSIPEERIRAIVRGATSPNPVGNRPWSTRTLGDALGVSHSTVRRIWDAYRVRPLRYEAWPPRPDPSVPLVPLDVVGVYLRAPDYAVAFSLGPASPRPAGYRDSLGRTDVMPGQLNRWLLNSPNLITGPSDGRQQRFLRFLGELRPRLGGSQSLRVIVSGPGLPVSRLFGRWRTRHPEVQFDFQPDLDTWKSRLLAHLRQMGGRSPRTQSFGGRSELARSLRLFMTAYSAESGPFEWIATSRELAKEEAGFRLRYDLSASGHTGFKKTPTLGTSMRSRTAPDPRAREMARAVLRNSLKVCPGERVTIESWTETIEYANAFVLEALRIGARPLLVYQDEPTYWAAVSEVRPGTLARLGEHWRAALRRSEVFVSFFGPSDRERFHSLPRATRVRLSEYKDALYAAAAQAGARAVLLALGRASEASARMYGVDLATWRNELIDATLVNPAELHRKAIRVAERLRRGRAVWIRHANGTDLRLGLRHRPPQVSDGRVPPARAKGGWNLVQLPAGVVTVALDERLAEGTFRSNVPNSIGVMDSIGEVAGGRWTFEHGRLNQFSFEQGQEPFAQSYGRAGAGRDRPGTLSVGLNERIAISPLLMDQGIGTITLQIGRNDFAGGATHLYWWAWLLLRGANLAVDGEWVLKGGKIVA